MYINRFNYNPAFTAGRLFDDKGNLVCYTLEDPHCFKLNGQFTLDATGDRYLSADAKCNPRARKGFGFSFSAKPIDVVFYKRSLAKRFFKMGTKTWWDTSFPLSARVFEDFGIPGLETTCPMKTGVFFHPSKVPVWKGLDGCITPSVRDTTDGNPGSDQQIALALKRLALLGEKTVKIYSDPKAYFSGL